MADKKISALTGATTPLAGTEVLPIVQGGSTVKVSVANLTQGRDTTVANLLTNGDITVRNAGGVIVGYAQNNGGWFDFAGTFNVNGTQISSASPTPVRVLPGGSESVRFQTNGNVTLQTGNLVVGTAGKGIDFSANGGDVLSQYDEGTWTPTFSGTVVGTLTATGTYTRIGRLVYWVANLVSTGSTTAVQDVGVIQGFPFVIGSGNLGTCSIVNRSNTSTIGLGQVAISAGSTTVYTCGWTALSNVLLSGFYEV